MAKTLKQDPRHVIAEAITAIKSRPNLSREQRLRGLEALRKAGERVTRRTTVCRPHGG